MTKYFDRQGRLYETGRRIGRGGEGEVWEIVGDSSIVLKVYSIPVDSDRRRKLEAQTVIDTTRLKRFAAWPIQTIGLTREGWPVGFTMASFPDRTEIHNLTAPRSRRLHFPNADWSFLVHVASNLARAVAAIHESGQVIGDLNDRNVVVAVDGTVAIIDCDSFQVTASGETFLCEVGAPTHTPPELRGKNLATTVRTPNQDRFGLAVVIFQLLFLGRHPFSGKRLDGGDSGIDSTIAERLYVYGKNTGARIVPTVGMPPLAIISPEMAVLFERAFVAGVNEERPSAGEWLSRLRALQEDLQNCPRNNTHKYRSSTTCPWCDLESKTPGLVLFLSGPMPPASRSTESARDLIERARALLLESSFRIDEMERVAAKSPVYVRTEIYQIVARRDSARKVTIGVATAIGIFSMFLGVSIGLKIVVISLLAILAVWRFGAANEQSVERKKILEHERIALSDQRRIITNRHNVSMMALAKQAMSRLDASVLEVIGYDKWLVDSLQKAERDAIAGQRQAYLRSCPLTDGTISGMGEVRLRSLRSHGITTAADVEERRIASIPGFGQELTKRLLEWRQQREREASSQVRVQEVELAKDRMRVTGEQERSRRVSMLTANMQALHSLSTQLLVEKAQFLEPLAEIDRRIAQIDADLSALG